MYALQSINSFLTGFTTKELEAQKASEFIKQEGRKKVSFCPGFLESSYYNFMEDLRGLNQEINSYIRRFSFYRPIGGYGAGMRESFDLNLKGVGKLLEIRNISNVLVIDTSEKLKKIYSELKENQPVVCITNQYLLQGGKGHEDAVAVFIQRQKELISLFVMDSKGNKYDFEAVKKQMASTNTLNLFVSKVEREVQEGDPVSVGFALHDCEVFNIDPNRMLKTLRENGVSEPLSENSQKNAESYGLLEFLEKRILSIQEVMFSKAEESSGLIRETDLEMGLRASASTLNLFNGAYFLESLPTEFSLLQREALGISLDAQGDIVESCLAKV